MKWKKLLISISFQMGNDLGDLMTIDFKDIFFLVLGFVIGLIGGVAIYWLPLKQFCNEWKALWNLVNTRYYKGNKILVKAGVDLKSISSGVPDITTGRNASFGVWHDEGVNWHFTYSGWKRARILHVYVDNPNATGLQPIYKVCHLDIL